jgi:heme exporter protein D
MADYLAMGGYGFYVWGAFGMTALVLVIEVLGVRARRRRALMEAHAGGLDTPTLPASEIAR